MAATNFSGPVVSANGFKTGSTTLTDSDFASIQALVSKARIEGLGPMSTPNGFGYASGSDMISFASGWAKNFGDGTVTVAAGGVYNNAITLARDGAGTLLIARRTSGVSISGLQTTDTITLIVDNIAGIANGNQIRFSLSSDAFATKTAYWAATLRVAHGDKLYLTFAVSEASFSGGELITNTFNGAQLTFTSAINSSCRVLGVMFNCRARPKIIIDFDDAFISQYTEIFPYMAKFGLVGQVAVIGSRVGSTSSYCTLAQLREMQAAGWGMVTHGDTAHSSLASAAAVAADVIANRDYVIQNLGGNAWKHYVYPGGVVSDANNSIGALQAAGMVTGRLVDANPQFTHQSLGLDVPLRLFSREISQTATVAAVLTGIDRSINAGSTIRLHGHRVMATVADPANEVTIADFHTLIDGIVSRIKDGLIDNITLERWFDGCVVV